MQYVDLYEVKIENNTSRWWAKLLIIEESIVIQYNSNGAWLFKG